MRTLYYVITPEICTMTEDALTGLKSVQVYEIFDNKPVALFDLELGNEECSEDAIQQFLDDNGMGDTISYLTEL